MCSQTLDILVFVQASWPLIRSHTRLEQSTRVRRGSIILFVFRPANQKTRSQKRFERRFIEARYYYFVQASWPQNKHSKTAWAEYMCSQRLDILICVQASWTKSKKNKNGSSEVHLFTEAQCSFVLRLADPKIRSQQRFEQRACVHRGSIFLVLFRPADQQVRSQTRLQRSVICV